jgi:Tol biopolymer transport system component
LWVIHADGTGLTALTRLTASNAVVFEGAWSADGSRIALASQQALDGNDAAAPNFISNIWTMRSDGTGATPLTNLTAASSVSPLWSPDGTKILFISARALDGTDALNSNSTRNLWVMNSDGSGARALTRLTANGAGVQSGFLAALWSPNGSQVVFSSGQALDGTDAANPNGVDNIWVMNADGTGAKALTQLTASGIDCFSPAWSPDSAKIAFACNRALDGSNASLLATNIWVMNADGGAAAPLTKLTASDVISFGSQWSPNGSKIAFFSTRAVDGTDALNQTNNVWVMNSDGSGATPFTRLTAANAFSFGAFWSPDGSELAFTSTRALDGGNAPNTNGTRNVWLINSDGTNASPLTRLTALGAGSDVAGWQP